MFSLLPTRQILCQNLFIVSHKQSVLVLHTATDAPKSIKRYISQCIDYFKYLIYSILSHLFSVRSSYYWSATTHASNSSNAWNVNFNNGNDNNNDKSNSNYVRCVRQECVKEPSSKEEHLFSFKNLYQAYKNCKKHKANKINTLLFENRLLDELVTLERELKQKTYRPSKSICFLCSSPKLREVFAATFRDRVVHHLLISYIEPFYEAKFIYDVYNNRKNKGTHKGVQRLQKFIQKSPRGYYLQLDISSFPMSTLGMHTNKRQPMPKLNKTPTMPSMNSQAGAWELGGGLGLTLERTLTQKRPTNG